ncbi:MAG: YobA family protein [Ruminococcus sp.]|nr:YobA family protein [Ruminococcus sp.]
MKKFLCTSAALTLFLTGCGNKNFITEDVGEDIPSQVIASESAAARKKRIETTTTASSSESPIKTEKIRTSSISSETSEKTDIKISDAVKTSVISETHETQKVSNTDISDGSYADESSKKPEVTTKNNTSSEPEQSVTETPARQPSETYYLEGIVYEVNKTSVLINEVDLGKIDVSFSDPSLLDGIKTGDTVEVTYNGELAETYPMQAFSTHSIKVTQKTDKNYQLQRFEYNDLAFSMLVPENWSNRVIEYPQEGDFTDWGIRFTPDGAVYGLDISWHSAFEIRESADKIPIKINGVEAKEYRKSGTWKFIVFENNYIAANNFFGTEEYDTYAVDIDIMLKTLEFV